MIRAVTRRGKSVYVIDINYRSNDGKKLRYRHDAQAQTPEGAAAEHARIEQNIAEYGSVFAPSFDTAKEPEQPPAENPAPFGPASVKGSIAEVMVLADIVKRGYRASIPYSQDSPYDLIVDRNGVLARVQIKHALRRDGALQIRCHSNGRIYTEKTIDWIAAYDAVDNQCYYVSAKVLGTGRNYMTIRVHRAKNNQHSEHAPAHEFTEF